MNTWWQGLNAREKQLVSLAGILLVVALLWLLIGKPIVAHHALLQQDLADAQDANTQMQQQRATIAALQSASPAAAANTTGSLHTGLINTLKQFQLDGAGTSTEEKDKDTVILKLESKSFDALAQCLAQMESQFAARATSMSLKPAAKSGTVDAEITLKR
jgi:general secretion pathway protein M